jgi:hypothetical protein
MSDSLIGKNVWIETPTKYWLGRCVAESMTHITLDDAAWIVRTGQYGPVMANQERIGQAEPIPSGQLVRVWVPSATILDWPYALVRERLSV